MSPEGKTSRGMPLRRRVLLGEGLRLAAAMGGTTLLAACGHAAPAAPQRSAAPSQKGATFRLGATILPSQLSNYNPFQQTGNWAQIFDYLYDQLFYFSPVDGKLLHRLGTGYKWNGAGTQLTVALHPGARWHDGKAVTAADVVFTYQALKQYPALDTYALWQNLAGVSAPTAGEVVFSLHKPFPSLPAYLSTVYIVPQHVWSAQNPTQYLNNPPAVGSGPFVFDHYTPGTDILLRANAHYFLGAPRIGYLDILMYANTSAASLAMLRGSVDTPGDGIAMPSLPQMLKIPGVQYQHYPALSNGVVYMNNGRPPLNAAPVRRAISATINRAALIAANEGASFAGNPGWVPTAFGAACDQALVADPQYGYDPKAAAGFLAQAGFHKGADGKLAGPDGQPLTLTYYAPASMAAQDKIASIIEQGIAALGITLTPRLATPPELTNLLRSGQYDLLQSGANFPPDPQETLFAYFGSGESAPEGQNTVGLNYARYSNPQVDALLAQSATTLDTQARNKIFFQVQQIIAAEAPVAVMYEAAGHTPYNTKAFQGYRTDVPVISAFSLMNVRAV